MTPLPYGFSLDVDADEIVYDYGSTITLDVDTIKILDAYGNDVTSNFYVTNIEDDDGTLTSYVIKGA